MRLQKIHLACSGQLHQRNISGNITHCYFSTLLSIQQLIRSQDVSLITERTTRNALPLKSESDGNNSILKDCQQKVINGRLNDSMHRNVKISDPIDCTQMHGYPNSEQVTEVEPGIVSFLSETTQLRHAKRSTKREIFLFLKDSQVNRKCSLL